MTTNQRNWIGYVAQHNGGFATPAANGAIWIYSYFVHHGTRRVDVARELASNWAQVRAILGY